MKKKEKNQKNEEITKKKKKKLELFAEIVERKRSTNGKIRKED
jgi:hypothetical protein